MKEDPKMIIKHKTEKVSSPNKGWLAQKKDPLKAVITKFLAPKQTIFLNQGQNARMNLDTDSNLHLAS